MRFFTYCYRDPSRGNEPIYIGKGTGNRHLAHLKRKGRHPLVQRLNKMRREGIEPVIQFLCKDVDEELAFLVEVEAISLYGRKDLGHGPLLNLSDGGEGPTGFVLMAEQRRKYSEGVKRAAAEGKIFTEAFRQHCAKRMIGNTFACAPKSPAMKAKLAAYAANKSDVHRQAIKEGFKRAREHRLIAKSYLISF